MFRKKKIREEFDEIFKTGNEKKIKQMLDENPWLLEEVSSEMEDLMLEEQQVIAALGVMEDELGGEVPVNDIVFSLKTDFKVSKSTEEVKKILKNVEKLDLVIMKEEGWVLSKEGGTVCDDFINNHLEQFDL